MTRTRIQGRWQRVGPVFVRTDGTSVHPGGLFRSTAGELHRLHDAHVQGAYRRALRVEPRRHRAMMLVASELWPEAR